jgi:hypothetical protein
MSTAYTATQEHRHRPCRPGPASTAIQPHAPWSISTLPTLTLHDLPRVAQAQRSGSFSCRAPCLSIFSLPLRWGRARVGVQTRGVPRPCFSPHPNRSPRLRRRRGASLTAPLPPQRGEGVESVGTWGKNRELHSPAQRWTCQALPLLHGHCRCPPSRRCRDSPAAAPLSTGKESV